MNPFTRRSRSLAAAWRAIQRLERQQVTTQADVDALTTQAAWRAIQRLERQQVTTQADVDALTTQAGEIASDLATAKTDLQTEIDALSAANPGLDLTALQAAVSPLDQAAKDLAGLKPEPTPGPQPPAP